MSFGIYKPSRDTFFKYESHHKNQQMGTVEQLRALSNASAATARDWMTFAKSRNTSVPKIMSSRSGQIRSTTPKSSGKVYQVPNIQLKQVDSTPDISPIKLTKSNNKTLHRNGKSALSAAPRALPNRPQEHSYLRQPVRLLQEEGQKKQPPRQILIPKQTPQSYQIPKRTTPPPQFTSYDRPIRESYNRPIRDIPKNQTRSFDLSQKQAPLVTKMNYIDFVTPVKGRGTDDYRMMKPTEMRHNASWMNTNRVFKGAGWKDTRGLIT